MHTTSFDWNVIVAKSWMRNREKTVWTLSQPTTNDRLWRTSAGFQREKAEDCSRWRRRRGETTGWRWCSDDAARTHWPIGGKRLPSWSIPSKILGRQWWYYCVHAWAIEKLTCIVCRDWRRTQQQACYYCLPKGECVSVKPSLNCVSVIVSKDWKSICYDEATEAMTIVLVSIALLFCTLCAQCLHITKHARFLSINRQIRTTTALHLSTADFKNGMTFELGKHLMIFVMLSSMAPSYSVVFLSARRGASETIGIPPRQTWKRSCLCSFES